MRGMHECGGCRVAQAKTRRLRRKRRLASKNATEASSDKLQKLEWASVRALWSVIAAAIIDGGRARL